MLALLVVAASQVVVSAEAPHLPSTTEITCLLQNAAEPSAGTRLKPTALNHWTWLRRDSDVLTCAADGAEPASVGTAQVTSPVVHVTLAPGRPVSVTAASSRAGLVEWRAWGDQGTVQVAAMAVSVGPEPVVVYVAPGERILRFKEGSAAPVSVVVGAHTEALHIPDAATGGEIFGLLPPQTYLPKAMLIDDGSSVAVVHQRVFVARGLAQGNHTIRPLYRGGVRGRVTAVEARNADTTEFFPASLPDVGALDVLVEPDQCVAGDEALAIDVRRVVGERSVRFRPVGRYRVSPSCAWTLEGLEGGRYDVRLVGTTPDAPAATVTVVPGQATVVQLGGRRVEVTGRVTFGESRPADRMRLSFHTGTREWETETDANGEYRVALGERGRYEVAVKSSRYLPSATFSRTFEMGSQRADFQLGDGDIVIEVRVDDGSVPRQPVQFTVQGNGVRLGGFVLAEEPDGTRIVGLSPGTYTVTAETAEFASESPVTVELSPERPTAVARIILERTDGTLVVEEPGGTRLQGARVLAGGRVLRERTTGEFSLRGLPVGAEVVVLLPGYSPVCRVFHGDAAIAVTLITATEVVGFRVGRDESVIPGAIVGLPGSDCPVPGWRLTPEVERRSADTLLRVVLAAGAFAYVLDNGQAHTLTVPGPMLDVAQQERPRP